MQKNIQIASTYKYQPSEVGEIWINSQPPGGGIFVTTRMTNPYKVDPNLLNGVN